MNITVSNQQSAFAVDEDRLLAAVRSVLQDADYLSGSVSIAVVDDPTIHELNRRFLDHDWPTDVLSFALDQRDKNLEGEIVISATTAAERAVEFGWTTEQELLLYAIHGALHLAGYRDKTAAEADEMRTAEAYYLERHGILQAGASPPRDIAEAGGAVWRIGGQSAS